MQRPTLLLSLRELASAGQGGRVTRMAAGEHSVVSLSNGILLAAGANHNGQLGLGHLRDVMQVLLWGLGLRA